MDATRRIVAITIEARLSMPQLYAGSVRQGMGNRSIADKLLLAFDALVLSLLMGRAPQTGKLIHGPQFAITTVSLPRLLADAELPSRKTHGAEIQQTKRHRWFSIGIVPNASFNLAVAWLPWER